jgi:ureidoglycolate hydrolase
MRYSKEKIVCELSMVLRMRLLQSFLPLRKLVFVVVVPKFSNKGKAICFVPFTN